MRRALASALALLLAASAAQAGWWDDAGTARRVTLGDVRRDPGRWLDVQVLVEVRYVRVGEPGDPARTRFTAKDWRSVEVVPAEVPADKAKPADAFARVFVSRGSVGEHRLAEAAAGARVELRACVRDTDGGEPWIEVLDVVGDGDPLTPEETSALESGDRLLASDNAAAAEKQFRGLLEKRVLPRPVQAALWRKVGTACWARKALAEAADAWTAALALQPSDAATVEKLAAAKAAIEAAAARNPPAPSRPMLPPSGIGSAAPGTVPAGAPAAPGPGAPPDTRHGTKKVEAPSRPPADPATPPPAPAPAPQDPPPAPPPPKPDSAGPK